MLTENSPTVSFTVTTFQSADKKTNNGLMGLQQLIENGVIVSLLHIIIRSKAGRN